MKLITSYKNADLDGTACAVAYAEFLKMKGEKVEAKIAGEPHKEARFVLEKFKIYNQLKMEETVPGDMEVVFLDASDVESLPNGIKPEQVVEVIDHRLFNDTNNFPNAKIQLELVGSCATLIAEKFFNSGVKIPL